MKALVRLVSMVLNVTTNVVARITLLAILSLVNATANAVGLEERAMKNVRLVITDKIAKVGLYLKLNFKFIILV